MDCIKSTQRNACRSFSLLPPEIREIIWNFAFAYDEPDPPNPDVLFYVGKSIRLHVPIPQIAQTCSEAWEIALRLRTTGKFNAKVKVKVNWKSRILGVDRVFPADLIEVLQGHLEAGGYTVLKLSLGQKRIASILDDLLTASYRWIKLNARCLIFRVELDSAVPNILSAVNEYTFTSLAQALS